MGKTMTDRPVISKTAVSRKGSIEFQGTFLLRGMWIDKNKDAESSSCRSGKAFSGGGPGLQQC
jgi:hypothetical protein